MTRKLQFDKLEEIKNNAYNCSKWYKNRKKIMHNKIITWKYFQPRQKVLLYNSRLHLFLRKLKSRRTGPYIIHKVHSHGAVEIHNIMDGATFQVNGHHLKPYCEYLSLEVEETLLKDSVYHDWSPYLLGVHCYIIFCVFFCFSFQLGHNRWYPLVLIRYYLPFTFLSL